MWHSRQAAAAHVPPATQRGTHACACMGVCEGMCVCVCVSVRVGGRVHVHDMWPTPHTQTQKAPLVATAAAATAYIIFELVFACNDAQQQQCTVHAGLILQGDNCEGR
jgi:hypothetical protein